MPSECERFWDSGSYAVVGRQRSKKAFPKITYQALKEQGKTVYPIDAGSGEVLGDKAYPDFASWAESGGTSNTSWYLQNTVPAAQWSP